MSYLILKQMEEHFVLNATKKPLQEMKMRVSQEYLTDFVRVLVCRQCVKSKCYYKDIKVKLLNIDKDFDQANMSFEHKCGRC